jgi:hypothetical protein
LEYLERHIKVEKSDLEADWLDGVVVALDFIKRNTFGSKTVMTKKVVLLSDLGCPSNTDKYDMILESMKNEDVEMTFL